MVVKDLFLPGIKVWDSETIEQKFSRGKQRILKAFRLAFMMRRISWYGLTLLMACTQLRVLISFWQESRSKRKLVHWILIQANGFGMEYGSSKFRTKWGTSCGEHRRSHYPQISISVLSIFYQTTAAPCVRSPWRHAPLPMVVWLCQMHLVIRPGILLSAKSGV